MYLQIVLEFQPLLRQLLCSWKNQWQTQDGHPYSPSKKYFLHSTKVGGIISRQLPAIRYFRISLSYTKHKASLPEVIAFLRETHFQCGVGINVQSLQPNVGHWEKQILLQIPSLVWQELCQSCLEVQPFPLPNPVSFSFLS